MYPVVLSIPALASRLGMVGSVASFAQRLGIGSKIADLVAFAKNNPLAFALTAKEMYDQGDALAGQLFSDPVLGAELQSIAERYFPKNDTLDLKAVGNLTKYSDELAALREAAALMGGMDRLMVLRRVLQLPDEYFMLHDVVKALR